MSGEVDRLRTALTGHYTVERELGQGGMATVYLADDTQNHRPVAVKVLREDYASSIARVRFLREIEIAANLRHPGILPLFDSGVTEDLVYYVMPYVEGESLRDLLDRELQLPMDRVLRIAREVGDALHYAHQHGVVHRDIKPANILLTAGRAQVADFGIARALWASTGERPADPRTTPGLAVGTPQYMSPEQWSAGAVDARTDVWALGCVVYEMIAGTPPFTGATPEAVRGRAQNEPPPALEVVRPGVGHAVQRVVERALAKVPADRWHTATAFADALEEAARAPESAEYRPRRRAARLRLALGAGAALTVAAVAAAAFLLRGGAVPLDDRKLVVFPLQARGDDALRPDGVRLGSLINSALETAEPLTSADGWTWLTPAQRSDPALVTAADLTRIARAQRARYALSGWVLRAGDSATVTVTLLDVQGDTTLPQVSQAGVFGPDFVADLGLRAVSGLLSRFLARGRRVELPLLQGHPLAAVVATVSGDVAYRDGKFRAALGHYHHALALDSTLVLAALKGASAASWDHDRATARLLAALAVRHGARAPARYRDFAAGLQAHLGDRPDSAVAAFTRALARDSGWTEAWMARGEVFYHCLAGGWDPDSLAEADFERARLRDPGFTPALYHLNEIALRQGWSPRADQLYRALRRAGPDSAWLRKATLLQQCVRHGPDGVDWTSVARGAAGAASELVMVGHGLAKTQPACAERALRAALAGAPRESLNVRWGAVVALQSVLVAERRYAEVRRLLDWSADSVHVAARMLQLVDAVAGVGTDSGAVTGLRMIGPAGAPLAGLGADELYWLGLWAWRTRDAARLGALTARAAELLRPGRADGIDTLIHGALAARLAVLRGDTARAVALLEALRPRGSSASFAWEWLPPLAAERSLLARLLLATRRYADAVRVAGVLETSQPIAYTMYLADGLRVRAEAAEALGRPAVAARARERLAAFTGGGRR